MRKLLDILSSLLCIPVAAQSRLNCSASSDNPSQHRPVFPKPMRDKFLNTAAVAHGVSLSPLPLLVGLCQVRVNHCHAQGRAYRMSSWAYMRASQSGRSKPGGRRSVDEFGPVRASTHDPVALVPCPATPSLELPSSTGRVLGQHPTSAASPLQTLAPHHHHMMLAL
ncbi:hypothetical protein B0J13DRAFT_231984 [Dactylonectria estremocensis]|uniref:Secreted protein n=1 Tax=Dactylonectria estremocensis TaxID=1079267 RepID=A0A9P9J7V7_9HYPO|nr:hypothetical protein B0J13DRAFT_231984 [Dactylonectria estremocensis]